VERAIRHRALERARERRQLAPPPDDRRLEAQGAAVNVRPELDDAECLRLRLWERLRHDDVFD
jgi:hypothetical protein